LFSKASNPEANQYSPAVEDTGEFGGGGYDIDLQ